MVFDRLRSIDLFADVPADDLRRICDEVEVRVLDAGEVLVREGEAGANAFVITTGRLEVVKEAETRETRLAVREAGEVIGEMALLRDEPRMATIRAVTDAEVLCIPRSALDAVIDSSPDAARAVYSVIIDRWEETTERLRHSERMAQLGALTAGVAHELNNPAAAVARAADQLRGCMARLREAVVTSSLGLGEVREVLEVAAAQQPTTLDALARADAEEAVAEWLAGREIADADAIAAELVDGGAGKAALEAVEATSGIAADSVEILAAAVTLERIAAEIESGSTRLSSIVGALRSYSYLGRDAHQAVDVRQGLDDTLLLFAGRLRGIAVSREYAEDLPAVMALGGELNQVWTNLLSNAADALAGRDDAAIVVRARAEDGEVVVEVEDNGPGIAPDDLPKVFDSFFTTKEPGAGTGLGLYATRRIVVLDHDGTIDVASEPGRTVFTVRLPAAT